MLIWLASYPRSGNTFFRLLLNHWYGLNTYSIHGDPVLKKMGADATVGHSQLPLPLDEIKASDDIYFVKTHDLPNDDSAAIYLVRDGRDAVVSHARYRISFVSANHLPENGKFDAVLEDVITNAEHFGGWGTNVETWLRQERVSTVRFEDLIADPLATVTQSVKNLDLQISRTNGEVPSFEDLHERWPQFFRKGQTGTWRDEMPRRLHRLFWKHHGDAMELVGYERDARG
jgi:Sulfotransferase domain